MLSHWTTYVPGIVGFVAPFVAALAALVASDRKKTKVALIVIGFALGAASFVAHLVSENTAQAERQEVRKTLGTFLDAGIVMMDSNQQKPVTEAEVTKWAVGVETYLRSRFDDSYVERFRSVAGIPIPPQSLGPSWLVLYFRTARLNEFIREVPQ